MWALKPELSTEEIELVKSLVEAFSIAYARYEDFVKLEKAKKALKLPFRS
jgi:hypothetical protein